MPGVPAAQRQALRILRCLVAPELGHEESGEGDRSPTVLCLWSLESEAVFFTVLLRLLERLINLQLGGIEVRVAPAKRQDLAAAHARCEPHRRNRKEWLLSKRRQDLARLFFGQDLDLGLLNLWAELRPLN